MKNRRETSNIIVVKIGSESIDQAELLVPEIVEITNNTHYRVLLVTSGAVEFGRRERGLTKEDVKHQSEKDPDFKRRLASYGQWPLMHFYNRILAPFNKVAAQILSTHADLQDHEERFHLAKDIVRGVWADGNIPIVNENDPFTRVEMDGLKRGADNDENGRLWTVGISAEMFAITTSTDGVYAKRDYTDTRIPLLPAHVATDDYIERICGNAKSQMGSGGMASKVLHGRAVTEENPGATVHIFDMKHSSLLEHLEYHQTIRSGGHLRPEEVRGGTIIY